MSNELEMSFPLLNARMHFLVETVDIVEEKYIDICQGYELIEKIKQYAIGDYQKLFEGIPLHVLYARLLYIEYKHEKDGMKVNIKIDGNDVSSAKVAFDTSILEEENTKKVAMIREVLDYDPEAETSLLKEFLNKEH